MASNEARAYFSLAGYSFDPDNITRVLGIEPTSVNRAGAGMGMDRPAISSWELSTEKFIDDIDVYAITNELIKLIEPKKDKILQAIEGFNLSPRVGVVLRLSADKEASSPEVGFGARTIRFLAEIGAFVDIDYRQSGSV